jgi:hypothetical protein
VLLLDREWTGRPCRAFGGARVGALVPKPVEARHMCTVAFAILSNASRHASAGGHLSIRSVRTVVAARMVKSTSSRVYMID